MKETSPKSSPNKQLQEKKKSRRKLRAGIYCRVSSDVTGQGLAVERQELECRTLAEREELEVVGVYVDNDISAYSGARRPEYARMVEDIREGKIEVLLCWHPDRLHRSPRELEDFIDLIEASKCRVKTVQAGDYDLSSSSGRALARILGAIARGESEHKSARLKSKHQQLARAGKLSGGGSRPFGYESDMRTIRPDEAELIREAVSMVLNGRTLGGIVKEWDARGIRTTQGHRWKPTSLRRILTSGRIAGVRELDGVRSPASDWKGIITEDESRRLRAILLDPSRRTNQEPRRYLLTGGIAVCGVCGANLVARPRGDKRRSYVCASDPAFGGCGKIRCLAEPLEDAVVEMVFEALDAESFTEVLLRREVREEGEIELAEALKAHREHHSMLIDMLGREELTRAEFLDASSPVKSKIADLESRLSGLDKSVVLSNVMSGMKSLRDSWSEMPIDAQRTVVKLLIEQIPVMPAVRGRNFFDASRIGVPKWRQ